MKIIILFDGPSTSGKTTYSSSLFNKYKKYCDIIEHDKEWRKYSKNNDNKKKSIEKTIIDKINNSKKDIIIVDMYLSFKQTIEKFIKDVRIYTILIYSNLKQVIKYIKKRKYPRRTTDILLQWTWSFSKTNNNHIDMLYKNDILKLINANNDYEKLNETNKIKLFNKIIKEFKFGNQNKIKIKPNNEYDLIIKTNKIKVSQASKFINEHLNIFIKPNFNLIRDHGVNKSGNSQAYIKWKKQFNIVKPCCIVFQKNNKTLYYIAVPHTTDKSSNTFKLIKKIHKENNFDLVISEGFHFEKGINNDKHFKNALTNLRPNEQDYNIQLGNKNNIDYAGVEENTINKLKSLKKYIREGIYIPEDIYGHAYLQMIPQLKRANLSYNKIIEELKSMEKRSLNKVFKLKKPFNINNWYQKVFGTRFDYRLIDNNSTAPIKNGTIPQQISVDIDKIREHNIIKNLFYYIQRYNRIVLSFGFNHSFADFNVLVNFFGKPKKIIKL